MNERYWEPGDAPGGDPLKDWVSENVIAALAKLIEDGGAWIGVADEKLTVTFHSFEMPEKEGEPSDIWHKDFDLLEMAMEWAGDYDGLQQLSDQQREDLEERARLLDELAAKFRARAGLSHNL
jgi:hypothetical protein